MNAAASTCTASCGGPRLRRLEWPALPRADLSVECRWLLGEAQEDVEEHAAVCMNDDASDDERIGAHTIDTARVQPLERSPYRQRRQRAAPTPALSPAQRAAKTILQLTLEMHAMETRGGLQHTGPEKIVCGDERVVDQQQWRASNINTTDSPMKRNKPALTNAVVATGITSINSRSERVPVRFNKPKKGERQVLLPIKGENAPGCPPGAKRGETKTRAQSRASSRKRVETNESRARQQLVDNQRRLAAWLANDDARQHHQQHNEGRNDVPVYSVEVESRIHEAMTRTTGQGLWKDPVASLIASEMTSESVFGGFVSTRRLAFDEVPTEVASYEKVQERKCLDAVTPHTPLEAAEAPLLTAQEMAGNVTQVVETPGSPTMVRYRAQEIRDDAQKLVIAGDIEDALATLQSGIKQLLFEFQDNQDEIQTCGFPYSQYAHACATRVQLRYRARYRKRVSTITFLQRVWRRHHAKTQAAQTRKYLAVNARVIQRQYKLRYERKRREHAAVRIQTCFRIYEEQKHLIHLHQACRILVNEEHRKRERIRRWQVLKKRTWRKLRMALQVIGLWKTRLRAASCIQKHWKGARVRVEYAQLLEAKTVAECERQALEDAFVQPRLRAAMVHYRRFLCATTLGKTQVTWQMNQPWIRFQRLRARNWQTIDVNTKVQSLCDILFTKMPANGKVRASAMKVRAMGHLLGIERTKLRQDLHVDISNPEAWTALFENASTPSPVVSASTQPQHTRKQRLRAWVLTKRHAWTHCWQSLAVAWSHFVLMLFWYVVLWPWSNVIRRRSFVNKQRACNVLERQQQFVLLKLLRHLYRQLNGQPNFSCAYCYTAFATALAYNTHVRMCTARTSDALAEWGEIHKDVAFLQDKAREKSTKGQKLQSTMGPQCPPPPANVLTPTLQLDAKLVQRIQATRSNRKALPVLVDMLLCCAVSHPFSSSDVTSWKNHVGPPEEDELNVDSIRVVAVEMVAHVCHLLQMDTKLHPLAHAQLSAFVDWKSIKLPPAATQTSSRLVPTTDTPSTWIQKHELFSRLHLTHRQTKKTKKMRMNGQWRRWIRVVRTHFVTWWQRIARANRKSDRRNDAPPHTNRATVLPVA